jgi:hypothetical protein
VRPTQIGRRLSVARQGRTLPYNPVTAVFQKSKLRADGIIVSPQFTTALFRDSQFTDISIQPTGIPYHTDVEIN